MSAIIALQGQSTGGRCFLTAYEHTRVSFAGSRATAQLGEVEHHRSEAGMNVARTKSGPELGE